jgi:hypothetical protein
MPIGVEAFAKAKELGKIIKSELVRSCDDVSRKKDGGERLNSFAFAEALHEAKGLSRSDGAGKTANRGDRKQIRLVPVSAADEE